MCTHCKLNGDGLAESVLPSIQRLGHRGSHILYRANCEVVTDESSGLRLFRIEDVFLSKRSLLVGLGLPNVFTAVPRAEGDPKGPGWDKFAAFMFWRQGALVANTKGRLQAGPILEVRNLPVAALATIRREMKNLSGIKAASCAKLNAILLQNAGFTFGNGKSLTGFVRPNKFASLLWRHGLKYRGQDLEMRLVMTDDRSIFEHIEGLGEDSVYGRELRSGSRFIQKLYAEGQGHVPAPVFPDREVDPFDASRWYGPPTKIGINRPRWLGVKFAFLTGHQAVYDVVLPEIDQVDELAEPLKPYQNEDGTRELDFQTKVKKNVLFNKPVIGTIRHFRHKSTDWYDGIPAQAAVEMLTHSESADKSTAALYNYVVIRNADGTANARFTTLRNQGQRQVKNSFLQKLLKIIAWILAKHVLVTGYDPNTVIAGEMWCYRDENGELVLCANTESGTYQPKTERLQAFAAYLEKLFGVKVRTFVWEEAQEA